MPYVSVSRQMSIGLLLAPGLPGGELGRKLRTIVKQIVKLAPDLYPGREAARLLAELPAKAEG